MLKANHKKSCLPYITSHVREIPNMCKKVISSEETKTVSFGLNPNATCGGNLTLN